ncbi:sigma-54-dependent transcriptional regulator [Acidipila rosea]|uniref:Two-component system response regulator HydG n=1 Tax=Acidipila rosea TaxID=768535 RepID=A0A4R1L2C0_9BACT|nr:sigma-54 dependent transcriptional regulator [Acidipila rosea]TCK72142.1 two-component system response regulator HydG [Acidipila rosea]
MLATVPNLQIAAYPQSAHQLSQRTVRMNVLVVDEDQAMRSACCEIAVRTGFAAQAVATLEAAREALRSHTVDIMLLDLKGAASAGLELLDEAKRLQPETAIIIMTAFATVTSAVEAMRTGASDYLTKPFALDELAAVLERAAERRTIDLASRKLRERLRSQQGLGNIIGRSPEMDRVYRILSKVSQTSHPVLILGESGTGKELIAKTIHASGPYASRPFLPVDCGSLVPTLMESELFGYVKGAFTGANRAKDGLLAAAEDGTIFLDEIGELPLDLQAKLLRALQEKEIRPVGATHRIPIRCRILAATNRDLVAMVEQGRFRKDLYYRLNVVNVRLPALRDRKEDIPLLAAHFLKKNGPEYKKDFTLDDEALRLVNLYPWPGNIRELENAITAGCSTTSGARLQVSDLPSPLQNFWMHARHHVIRPASDGIASDLPVTTLAELEKKTILTTIDQLRGDKLMAAKLLGIGKTTLYRKLKEYGIGEGAAEA